MSAATAGYGERRNRYRRRRPIPALIFLVLLVVAAVFVWVRVFEKADNLEAATRCNLPTPTAPGAPTSGTPQASLGAMLDRHALDHAAPAPPQDDQITVLNANGHSKEASLVAEELEGMGFAQGGKPGNDPVYTNYDLNCHGQIRFGPAGASAARTLSLVMPCAQLVRDEREGSGVDLALGQKFDDIQMTPSAQNVLDQLRTGSTSGTHDSDAAGAAAAKIDPELLQQARDAHC